MNTLTTAWLFSLVRVAIRNYSFSFLMYREAESLEVGARTTLVMERTSPWDYSASVGLNLKT
jgi:hypothetical protein